MRTVNFVFMAGLLLLAACKPNTATKSNVYLGSGIPVNTGNMGIATVFGYDKCPLENVIWLFGETQLKNGCSHLKPGIRIRVRLIYSNGQIGHEQWLVERVNGDYRLKTADGFIIENS